MSEQFEESAEFRTMAARIIDHFRDLHFIRDDEIAIEYLTSTRKKTKGNGRIYAECIKVNEMYKYLCGMDYIIVVYEPNVSELSQNQLQILLLHELKHVGENGTIQNHDIEDFREIIDKYGEDWAEFGRDVPDILDGGDA